MIKIAHEAPLSIMNKVQKITDYDYALVHLFEDPEVGEKYLKFFSDALKKGRDVILDNSVFELGSAFDSNRFRSWIKTLKPTYYVLPDVLRNAKETMRIAKEWEPIPGCGSIGVVQGITWDDLVTCYRFLAARCDMVALPFNLPIYLSLGNDENQSMAYCKGRRVFIDKLMDEGVLDELKPMHLLGTVLPQEIKQYEDYHYSFIKSIDTSNPVIHGLHRIRYTDNGLEDKVPTMLHKMIGVKVTPSEWTDIKFNIKKYRNFAGYVGE